MRIVDKSTQAVQLKNRRHTVPPQAPRLSHGSLGTRHERGRMILNLLSTWLREVHLSQHGSSISRAQPFIELKYNGHATESQT